MQYERPTVVELGSVIEFTKADNWDLAFDGALFHNKGSGGGHGPKPTS